MFHILQSSSEQGKNLTSTLLQYYKKICTKSNFRDLCQSLKDNKCHLIAEIWQTGPGGLNLKNRPRPVILVSDSVMDYNLLLLSQAI